MAFSSKTLRVLGLVSILVLLLISCMASIPGIGTGDPSGPTPVPSNVLFQDDFSSPTSGWNQITRGNGETAYVDGAYRIYVNEANKDIWANPGLNFTDVQVEVDTVKVGGPDDNDFGIICRAADNERFYFFIISSDGYYGIGKINGQDQRLINSNAMQPSEKIRKGNVSNHLRADCVGDRLALYINGEQVAEVTDGDFATGDVGLIAGSFEVPGTDIRFDNFSVLKPE